MYYFAVRRQHVASAVAGAAAILMRQTNVVWVAFSAGTAALAFLEPRLVARADAGM
jgi:hypothetical protein